MYGSIGIVEFLFVLASAAILVIPAWKLSSRLGYPGWLGMLILLPLVNLGALYFIAFSSWPNLKATLSNS